MFDFINNNILLVLTILGAIISFLASFMGIISKQKPVMILAILAVLGFVIGITYQVYNFNKKQEDARAAEMKQQIAEAAQKARDNVIDEINVTVQKTKITVDAIADQLKTTRIQDAATELVSISTSGNNRFLETEAYAKAAPNMWPYYADWLQSLDLHKAAPSLTLTISARHHYDSGLLLAYLLTSSETRGQLKDIIKAYSAWHNFAAEDIFLKCYSKNTHHLQWVLFYEGNSKQPVAYAPAQTFTQELMVYHRLKQHNQIDSLLNTSGSGTIQQLREKFPSIRTSVFTTQSPSVLVKSMIERQLPIAVTYTGERSYIAELVNMIQIAASKN